MFVSGWCRDFCDCCINTPTTSLPDLVDKIRNTTLNIDQEKYQLFTIMRNDLTEIGNDKKDLKTYCELILLHPVIELSCKSTSSPGFLADFPDSSRSADIT